MQREEAANAPIRLAAAIASVRGLSSRDAAVTS